MGLMWTIQKMFTSKKVPKVELESSTNKCSHCKFETRKFKSNLISKLGKNDYN